MKLHLVGCSHHRTPIELREQLSFSSEQVRSALQQVRSQHPNCEAVLLSTCNRVEFYMVSEPEVAIPGPDWMVNFLASFHGMDSKQLASHVVSLKDRDAIKHLFTVASSLDSLVVGETQILSQVRQAYDIARAEDIAGAHVHSLFQHASYVSKRVANETEIHRKRVSIPSVAVSEIAAEFFERLDDKKVLVIGSGEMGEETLRYLIDAGAKSIALINRSYDKAVDASSRLGGRAYPWEDLDREMMQADLVVSTTGSQEPIVDLVRFRRVMSQRKRGAILILDLAVPRDFEPSIGELPNVYLYAVDDLQRVCQKNAAWRSMQYPKAEKIILEETERFVQGLQVRTTVPTIRRLREHADEIKNLEWQRLRGKLQQMGVNGDVEGEIQQSMERLVNKLLHSPMQSVREEAENQSHSTLLDALKRLFKLAD